MRLQTLIGTGALSLLLACSAGSQGTPDAGAEDGGPSEADASHDSYTYPGCANEDLGCPRLPTLYCALESIIAQHSACTQDADCAFATFTSRCSGFPPCPPVAVAAQTRPQFEAAFQAEIDRYCAAHGDCTASEGVCPHPVPSYRAACVAGTCRAQLKDGGM